MTYNPRFGVNGRVAKDDFSIDGKSWDYRDPANIPERTPVNRGEDLVNENAYAMTNPLYDYSYGQVRDAAKKLGIGNVDEQAEVNELLKYIQEDSEKEVKEKEPKKDPVEQKAQDFKDDYVDKVIKETKIKPKQSIGDVSGGDNSIVSPINQDNDIDIAKDNNQVSQNNSIAQMLDNMKQSLRFAY